MYSDVLACPPVKHLELIRGACELLTQSIHTNQSAKSDKKKGPFLPTYDSYFVLLNPNQK